MKIYTLVIRDSCDKDGIWGIINSTLEYPEEMRFSDDGFDYKYTILSTPNKEHYKVFVTEYVCLPKKYITTRVKGCFSEIGLFTEQELRDILDDGNYILSFDDSLNMLVLWRIGEDLMDVDEAFVK